MSASRCFRLFAGALAVAAGLLLTACGGGSDSPAPTAQQAVERLTMKAAVIRANAVPLADAATQLFDAAEGLFPQWFPPHQANQGSSPVVFRHYPGTGVYAAVMTATVGPYLEGHVYIAGPPFGNSLANPKDLGALTSFFTPTEPATGGLVVSAASKSTRNGSYSPAGAVFTGTGEAGWNGQTADGKFEMEVTWADNATIKRAHIWFFDANDVIKFFGCDGGKAIACTGVSYEPLTKKLTFTNVNWNEVETDFFGGPDKTISGGEHLTLNGTIDAK